MIETVTQIAAALAECVRVLLASPLGSVSGLASVALLVAALALVRKLASGGLSPRRAPALPPRDPARGFARGSGKKIACESPATGERLGECRAYTPDEVRAAFARASEAQEEWARTSFAERRAVLYDVLDWTLDHAEEIVARSCAESGKTRAEAMLGEVMTTCEKIRWTCAEGEQYLAPESRAVPSMLLTKSARVEYHPVGVVGAIVPFNYPYFNVLSAVVAALFSGNGAVVKPSEFTSHSAEWIEDMLRGVLARRGHSPELVQVVTGFAETGAALVEAADKVLFIGSVPVGRAVMRTASATLTPVILELGGKDAFVVCEDADMAHLYDIAVRGAFINCGQNCIAAERMYVHASVYDAFCDEMQRRVSALRQGASQQAAVDFGAMTTPAQGAHVALLVADAVTQGARVLVGGAQYGKPQNSALSEQQGGAGAGAGRCSYHQPTILRDVTHEMRVVNEETFGPVMSLIKWSTEDELIRMVNGTPFGLGGSVFSRDYKRAERIASRMVTGMVTINDFGMVPMVGSLPFGGVGDSGFGKFNGPEGLRGFCHTKSIVSDRFGLRTDTPAFLQYPVSSSAPEIVRHALRMIFGGWADTVPSVFRMVKAIVSAKD